ncbi:MAG: hypothetical protein WCD54_09485 [Pseudolabrys sp.]
MPFWVARVACLALALSGGVARGDDLADFNAAVEAVSAHNRVAIGYLRTGNADLASLEIDRLRDFWNRLNERFSGKRPNAFEGNALYGKLFTAVNARLVGADIMLKTGRLDAASDALNSVRGDLYDLRKASGVVVLADCVRDANATMDALMIYNDRAIDWDKSEIRSGLAQKATSYDGFLTVVTGLQARRCARPLSFAGWSMAPRPASR